MGCRSRVEQSALLRVVAVVGAHATSPWLVVPDGPRRGQGRGAYVHPDPKCLSTAIARRAFGRALRLPAKASVDASAVQEWLAQQ
ncbi:MAG: YlxR family protein [Ornithinimicrobium sp.]|uniref:YlxR family protein n=1 Tax=Ornithinimicrobium sp. TaxID=1977084 RepID=UPI0026DEFBBB|nr:YlxR family protein [Ornithinimicrobium sp.]MDO5739348.1 YlxR family protein [Ornithinimicrobium sp.]